MALPAMVCCPECRAPLTSEPGGVRCAACTATYPVATSGQIDLRPQRRFVRQASFTIDPVDPLWSPAASSPGPSLRAMAVNDLAHVVPRADGPDALALEVGCGPRGAVRTAVERGGYRWIGVDWQAAAATYLADVHALPFRDASFALVASDAVLEHVRYPHVGIREMARVLKPGGVMIGEVAFLQPYHASYFHMTHEAILDLVRYAGLEPTLYANGATSAFRYLARRALPRWDWLAWPADRMFRLVAKRRQTTARGRNHDIHFACSVLFAATKPEA